MKWGMHINGAWFLSASINYLKLYSWLFLYAPAQTTGRARHSELWNIYPPATFLRTWKQIILYNAYLAWQHCEEKKPWVMRICILNLHSHITASCCKLTNCRYHSPILYGCLQSLCGHFIQMSHQFSMSLPNQFIYHVYNSLLLVLVQHMKTKCMSRKFNSEVPFRCFVLSVTHGRELYCVALKPSFLSQGGKQHASAKSTNKHNSGITLPGVKVSFTFPSLLHLA